MAFTSFLAQSSVFVQTGVTVISKIKTHKWQSAFQVDNALKIPPTLFGIAVVGFAPYATFLFSWDYAIIIADKSCLLPWL